jgi:hypothetical protein
MAFDIHPSQERPTPDDQHQGATVSPTTQAHTATGTVGASVTVTAREAGVTRRVPFVPTVFRTPCESCGHEVEFPFNERLSVLLDWLTWLADEYPQPTDKGR